ncbi:Spectrin Beta Chain, Non-Erythrocytic 5 [Manis pentadactyla]|nr:Spectrin Beta Chain, Non-Erythrocytic 5 [Manis pentadactyla]
MLLKVFRPRQLPTSSKASPPGQNLGHTARLCAQFSKGKPRARLARQRSISLRALEATQPQRGARRLQRAGRRWPRERGWPLSVRLRREGTPTGVKFRARRSLSRAAARCRACCADPEPSESNFVQLERGRGPRVVPARERAKGTPAAGGLQWQTNF